MNRQESRSVERDARSGEFVWRRKSGLETPLQGRFYGEGRKLFFAPPPWYDGLVNVCMFGGCAYALLLLFFGERLPLGVGPEYFFIALMVACAGLWGALSNERMVCDLRTRTYARREGTGLKRRIVKGSLQELDALVLYAEIFPMPSGLGINVIYRLVLYWKGSAQPLLVVERESAMLSHGSPINQEAGRILTRGQAYAKALGVRYFDNSYFHSSCPVPVI